jgi:hypothetical protein
LVEQLAFNQLVVGSNPTRPTIFETREVHASVNSRVFFRLLFLLSSLTAKPFKVRAEHVGHRIRVILDFHLVPG